MKRRKTTVTGPSNPSRRRFLKGVGLVGAGSGLVGRILLDAPEARAATAGASAASRRVDITINGKKRSVDVEPRTTLLSAMRDRLDPPVSGPKLVCDQGSCGACTVLLDEKPVYSCLVLAVDVAGRRVTTAEGLGTPKQLSAVQSAFVEKDGQMCGFCTPGFAVSVSALLNKVSKPTAAQVREACRGNLCRCGTYPKILEAVAQPGGANRG